MSERAEYALLDDIRAARSMIARDEAARVLAVEQGDALRARRLARDLVGHRAQLVALLVQLPTVSFSVHVVHDEPVAEGDAP